MKKETEKPKRTEKVPALGDIIDLTLDGHEKGLLRIGTVVCPQLLLRHLPNLHRRLQRRHLLLLRVPLPVAAIVIVGRRPEHPRNHVVHGEEQRHQREEGRRS